MIYCPAIASINDLIVHCPALALSSLQSVTDASFEADPKCALQCKGRPPQSSAGEL